MTDVSKDELFSEGQRASANAEGRPILSDKEIETAKRIARERVEKAMKEAEVERIITLEMESYQREQNRLTGKADLDEEVTVHVDCAEFADRLRINGKEYFHGYSYKVTRALYDSMRDIMFRGHLHQNALDGKDLAHFYRKKVANTLSGAEEGIAA